MTSNLKTLLSDLGLSTSETDIYLASLQLGEASVAEIAHAAKLPRTTAASILERLRTLGFVSLQKNKGKFIYWIEDPSVLMDSQKAKLDTMQQLTGRLHSAYHKGDKKPTAEIYDSRGSIVNLISKILGDARKGDLMLTIDSPNANNYQQVMTDELFHALSRQKVAKGIQTRSLIPSGQEGDVRPQALAHAITVKVMPSGIFFDSSLWICGPSVVLFSGTHAFAIRVVNRHMAESMRSIFEYLWLQSRPL